MLDAQMREPLFDYLEEFYGKIRIFEEKNFGDSRLDVLGVIDGAFIGLEIKSDSDTYSRLKTQTKDYDKCCDINYLVVGKSHKQRAAEYIPSYWGLICVEEAEGRAEVTMEQIPGVNPLVELSHQLAFLWRPELALLLEKNELPAYKLKSKQFVRDKLLEKVPEDILKNQITELLFERDYQKLLDEIQAVRLERGKKRRKRPKYRKRKKSKD